MSKRRVDPFVPPSPLDETELEINDLIETGRKRGYLTYEELNTAEPEEAPCPAMMDRILQTLDLAAIEIIDGTEIETPSGRAASCPAGRPARGRSSRPEDEEQQEDEEETESALDLPITTEKIDDPVRMYLTQMGEIPLLTRDEEISLAKKIEITRKRYRHRVLESGIGIAAAIRILQEVARGDLAFDRTLRIGTADPVGKDDLQKRMPVNLRTLEKLVTGMRADMERIARRARDPKQIRAALEKSRVERGAYVPSLLQPSSEGPAPPRGGGDPDEEDPPRARGVQGARRGDRDRFASASSDLRRRNGDAVRHRGRRGAAPGARDPVPRAARRLPRFAPRTSEHRFAEYEEAKRKLSSGQPAPRGLDRQEVPQPRPLLPRPHPGGQHRPDEGGREVRVPPRLQVLDLRHVVDPPGHHPLDRRPGADDPHPGPHDRDDEQAAQRHQEADPEEGPRAVDRGDRRGQRHLASRRRSG